MDHLTYLTPSKFDLKIISPSSYRLFEGQELIIEGKIGLIKRQWHSKITFLKEYRYIDEMLLGPFKKWVHSHSFEKIDKDKTKVIDDIDFLLPYGIIGRLLTPFALFQLKKIFDHREKQTISLLSKYNDGNI